MSASAALGHGSRRPNLNRSILALVGEGAARRRARPATVSPCRKL